MLITFSIWKFLPKLWSIIAQKNRTALRVLREQGPAVAGGIARDKLIQFLHKRPGGLARVEGCRFRVSDLEENVRVPLLMNEYEKEEREAVKRFLNRSLPVIELGGSLGVVSCVINKRLAHPEKHVVVEADPNIVPKLTANRELNACKFEILNCALAYDADEVAFAISHDTRGGGIYVQGTGHVTVRTVTLQKLAQERGFSRFTLVCDIEGSEVDLVAREKDLLASAVDTFILETHPKVSGAERVAAMLRDLKSLGFETADANTGTFVFKNTRQ
jgi:FkbM family methyltransferase